MKPRVILFALIPIALLLLPLGVFWVDQAIADGEIARNVSIAGIDVSGLSPEDATATLEAYEGKLQTMPAVFDVNDRSFRLDPRSISLEADVDTAVERATAERTGDGLFSRLAAWIGGFSHPVDVPLPVVVDREAVDDQLLAWQDEAIPNPAYEGAVTVEKGEVVVQYPRPGERLDVDTSGEIVFETVTSPTGREATLPVVDSVPVVTHADLDEAATEVERIISEPVVLTNEDIGFTMTFSPEEIARAVYTRVNTDPVEIEILIDDAVVADLLEPHRGDIELRPVSARFKASMANGSVTIVPSRYGTKMDVPAVSAELLAAAKGDKSGVFPVARGDEPRFTTEEAKAYGPLSLVSKFTTRTPGKNRVHNIHLMADTVDETVVWPGHIFSINEKVGPRTLEKGYLEDCAIIGGTVQCEGHAANIGGGVSQFSTTLYNAVFYGCYEDIEHKPHSLYFSKYPKVIEATMGYPSPDVKFLNNTDAPVIIRAAYTKSTITVFFFGNNGGKKCTAEWGDRTNPTEHDTVYVSAAEEGLNLAPGQEKRVRKGIDGFTQTVTRYITYPDGTKKKDRTWKWTYMTQDEQIAVHPCMVTGKPVNCPVKLPSYVGRAYSEAYAQLRADGFGVIKVEESVSVASKDGIVLSMDPSGGTLASPGSTVTLKVGVYSAPPPSSSTTTTTTTEPGDGDG